MKPPIMEIYVRGLAALGASWKRALELRAELGNDNALDLYKMRRELREIRDEAKYEMKIASRLRWIERLTSAAYDSTKQLL